MPKATITLPNKTVVTIEGDSNEIKELLDYYSRSKSSTSQSSQPDKKDTSKKRPPQGPALTGEIDHLKIINLVKNCDEAEAIEYEILDKTSQVDRTLLPLYIVEKYLGNKVALTSGDISKITVNLGIPISVPNVSGTLTGTASRYVMGDKTKKKGRTIRYKITKKGMAYLESVITGATDDISE